MFINYFNLHHDSLCKSVKYFLVIFIAATISCNLTSCGGGGGGPVTPSGGSKSGLHALNGFNINTTINSGLSTDCKGVIVDSLVLITVPDGIALNSLIPDFSISANATLYVNGVPVTSGKTPVDMTKSVKITVVAENGTSHAYYWLLARNGNATFDNQAYTIMKNFNIPGISLAATKNEKLVYSAGYGFAETETHTRVTPNMLFRLGSVSKQQTALCIMTLYEEGKLQLTDHVFGNGGILQNEFQETSTYPFVNGVTSVTVKNLLEHNSGWTDQLIFDTSEPIASMTLDQRIDYLIHHVSMSSAVGSTYHYFNMGFCILGRIVEKLTGKTFEAYLREVTAKAGVTDMWIDKTTRAEKRSNEVVYYSQASGGNAYLNPMEVVSSCGAVIASAPELMQLLCAEDYGTVVPDILKSSTLDLMYTPSANYSHYGLGWRLNHGYYTNWASYHGGNLAGTGTLWARGSKGVNAVVLCNSRSYREDIDFDTSLYDLLGTVMGALGD